MAGTTLGFSHLSITCLFSQIDPQGERVIALAINVGRKFEEATFEEGRVKSQNRWRWCPSTSPVVTRTYETFLVCTSTIHISIPCNVDEK